MLKQLLLTCTLLFIYAFAFGKPVIHISQQEALEKFKQDNVVLIDVRTVREYNAGHIPGAINIPHRDILKDLSLLKPYQDNDIILYCHSGVRVGKVTSIAAQSDLNLFHIKGDYRAWRAAGLEVAKPYALIFKALHFQ